MRSMRPRSCSSSSSDRPMRMAFRLSMAEKDTSNPTGSKSPFFTCSARAHMVRSVIRSTLPARYALRAELDMIVLPYSSVTWVTHSFTRLFLPSSVKSRQSCPLSFIQAKHLSMDWWNRLPMSTASSSYSCLSINSSPYRRKWA